MTQSVESSIERARSLERAHDWSGAAMVYGEALESSSERVTSYVPDIRELRAYALYRASFQADSNEEFRARIAQTIDAYGMARGAYLDSGERAANPLALRCEAMTSFSEYQRETEGKRKGELLLRTWDLAKQSLDGFEEMGDGIQFGRTCEALEGAAAIALAYLESSEERVALVKDALKYCERAVALLENEDDKDLLAEACVCAARHLTIERIVEEPSRKEMLDKRALELTRRAFEASRRATMERIVRTYYDVGLPRSMPLDERNEILDELMALSHATRDHLAMGIMAEWISSLKGFEVWESADSEQARKFAEEAYELAVEAGRHFSIVSHRSPCDTPVCAWAPQPGYSVLLAISEPDLRLKRKLALRGLEESEPEMKVAEASAIPEHRLDVLWGRATLLMELAKTEEDADERRKLLSQLRDLAIEYADGMNALYSHDRFLGGGTWHIATAEFDLADMTTDDEERRQLLEHGITQIQEAYEGLLEQLFDWDTKLAHFFLGKFQYLKGEMCLRLHDISHDDEHVAEAVESFEKAAEMYRTAGQPSRVAECLWKAAVSFSVIGERFKSSERFSRAGENFRQAAKELPQLGKFYEDHALYMDAWAELEHARHHHERQEHGPARESYERASSILAGTRRWNVFSQNYSAWSLIERGEELSRSDANEESATAFREAARLFDGSKEAIEKAKGAMEHQEESRMAERLVAATDLRKVYCGARAAIEDARILDKQGLESEAAESYAEATRSLEEILDRVETDQDRHDLRLILTLTKAWQRMAEAEATVDSSQFGEAASLFEQAKELSSDKNAKLLATGHSRFCKALQAGMEFSDTGEAGLHAEATKHLESAAKYYLRAGMQNASEYANASKLLFDGYVHMDRASKEDDQEKKARLFTLAEKVLEASAASYERSQYPGKRDQIVKLLEKVRRDRELAVSLTKALHPPDIVSATTSFSSPTSRQETAVGTERFDHADVQATIIARPVDLKVGEDFRLEIELVNAGRGSALLTKVEKVIPQGFDLVAGPENCRVEDSYLNLRGRKLDTLKTEDFKLVLKPKIHGEFKLTPRIMYLDDSGKYRSCEPESVDVTVRELGISGWLKGPDTRR